jgi:hypothetical protein
LKRPAAAGFPWRLNPAPCFDVPPGCRRRPQTLLPRLEVLQPTYRAVHALVGSWLGAEGLEGFG